jgi:hypothetical protein
MPRDCTGTDPGQRSSATAGDVSTVQPAADQRFSAISVTLVAASPSTMHCTSWNGG